MTWWGTAASGEVLFATADAALYDFNDLDGDVQGGAQATTVSSLQGNAIATGTPEIDQILKWTGSEWAFSPDVSGGGAPSLHALLGVYHTNTVSHVPVNGDLIVGSGGNTWNALSLGAQGQVLYSNGTDVVYTQLGQNTPFEVGTSGAPSMTFLGDLDTGAYLSDTNEVALVGAGLELFVANGDNEQLTLNGGQVVRTQNIGVNTTLNTADYFNFVTATPLTVTLPAAPTVGQMYYIKDRDGNASGGNRITIAGNGNTIDGNASVQIRKAYASFTLIYSGTEWHIV